MEIFYNSFIGSLGVELGTYPRRGGEDGCDVIGKANVLSEARRIGHDEHRRRLLHKPHTVAFPVRPISPPAARQDEHHIWSD